MESAGGSAAWTRPSYVAVWSLCCGPLLAVLCTLLAGAVTWTWAKVELVHHGCNSTYYIGTYGACDSRFVDADNDNKRCMQWKDISDWEDIDAQGNGDTHFADDAENLWKPIEILLAAAGFAGIASFLPATTLRWSSTIGSDDDVRACAKLTYPAVLAMTPLAFAAFVMAMSSSQLNADAWKDATGCDAEITWMVAMPLTLAAFVFPSCAWPYLIWGRAPVIASKNGTPHRRVQNDPHGGRIMMRPSFAAQAIESVVKFCMCVD